MKKLAVIVALMVVAAACSAPDDAAEAIAERMLEQAGGGNVDISTDDDGGFTMSVEGEDGTETVSFNEGIPDGFPFPVPDDYEVGGTFTYESDAGTGYSVVIQTGEAAFDDVKEMYVSWLEGEGFEVSVDEMSGTSGKFAFITAERGDVIAGVSMTIEPVSNEGSNVVNATVITLSWDPR